MGRLEEGAAKLFYEFSLEEMVPGDHLLRKIDRFLDFDDLRAHLKPFYSHTGRPSVDPELMCRMLIVGYCYGIRSERRLCQEVHLNLAYRWFCNLGIEDQVPNHSTFSKARHGRFRESDLFRQLFEQVVFSCMSEGLVKGEGFAVDASLIRADASEDRAVDKDEPVDWSDPKIASRPVSEYLDAIDQDEAPRKKISLIDPTARWTAAIMDVEATPAHRTAEVDAAKRMIDRTEDRFGLKPKRLMGDGAYGAGEILAWMVDEKKIAPHVTLLEPPGPPTDNFSIKDFVYDKDRDLFTCPNGKELLHQRRQYKVPRSGITKDKKRMYRARSSDCAVCPLKSKCCPNARSKRVGRSIYEHARDEVRRLRESDEYEQSRCDRRDCQ